VIATYALCGFSNFSSIAIQLGGISIIAPNQQGNLSRLGLRALLAASLACLMTATIAGMLFG
jgi:CNT family concentrative nucleoside transporter